MQSLPFSLDEESYVTQQITLGDDRVATKTLQWLCERVRKGFYFVDSSRIRVALVRNLSGRAPSTKRWALNALALLGSVRELPAVKEALRDQGDPDLLVAAVAALFAIADSMSATKVLTAAGIPLEGLTLIASAQKNPHQRGILARDGIPLETDNPEVLRAAIILAGTDGAPENLFHARLSNVDALAELNLHHVASVSKYSIWAMDQLGAGYSRLKVKIGSDRITTPEIRKWVYRLLVSDVVALAGALDVLDEVRRDASEEVREEVAIELREVFVEGVQGRVITWHGAEASARVRELIVDHIAAQSDRCPSYAAFIIEEYGRHPARSDARRRIEAAAKKTALYSVLRRKDVTDEGPGLFPPSLIPLGSGQMTQININNSTVGAVSGSGDVYGTTLQVINSSSSEHKELLERVARLLDRLEAEPKRAGAALVRDAASAPTKTSWQSLRGWFGSVRSALVGAGETVESVTAITEAIQAVADSLM